MADAAVIRTALAAQITLVTGLRTLAEPRDQVNPPVGVVLASQPYVVYGQTTDGTCQLNFRLLMLLSDGAPTEKVQRALDSYLGIGPAETASIAQAIQYDPTLGGAAHFTVPVAAGAPSRVEYNGVTYFGSRIEIQVGAI